MRTAATSGDPRFFLGTDSAPHTDALKENACGCAGCFTATNTMSILAHVFEEEGALDRLEGFTSRHGPAFYGLPVNDGTLTLTKGDPVSYPDKIYSEDGTVTVFDPGFPTLLERYRMIPSSYPSAEDIARLTARMLLEIEAVHFNAEEPFTLASGLPSPTYIDCRKLISYPRIRSTLMDFLTVTVMRNAGFEAFDNIAGGETAGIPFAALVAERMALPMTYVRKKPKGYGRNARIEGAMSEGERVLLVEDLTTDGGSKLSFVDAIRETGASCGHTAVIFYYGIFPRDRENPRRSRRRAALSLHLVGRSGRGPRAGRLHRCDAGWGRGVSERSA